LPTLTTSEVIVDIAALIAWILTAGGGFVLLATWIRGGGHRQPGNSNFPPAVIFGHFGLAALGLVIFIVYVVSGSHALAWVAFVLLVPVALLGFAMFARWLPAYRRRGTLTGAAEKATASAPAERNFPVAVVGAHGVLAVVTVVLVLLTALGVGVD
jgi:manganese efflux pump family protein